MKAPFFLFFSIKLISIVVSKPTLDEYYRPIVTLKRASSGWGGWSGGVVVLKFEN